MGYPRQSHGKCSLQTNAPAAIITTLGDRQFSSGASLCLSRLSRCNRVGSPSRWVTLLPVEGAPLVYLFG